MAQYKVEICGVNTSKLPLLSEEEKEELFKEIAKGNKQARETYIKGNLRLVLSIIQRFTNSNENIDDLFQIGCIGLIKAIDNFDLTKLDGTILGGRQGGMPAMTLNYTLHERGVKGLKVDTSVDFASLSGAFIGGQGDFVTLFEPNALKLEQEGFGYVVASIGELGGEVPYTSFNALKSYIEENPEIIEKFTNALQKGIDYTFDHSSEDLAKLLVDYFPDTSLNDIEETIERYKKADSWYRTTYIAESGYNHMQEIVEYNGFLTKKVDYSILVDNTYNHEK